MRILALDADTKFVGWVLAEFDEHLGSGTFDATEKRTLAGSVKAGYPPIMIRMRCIMEWVNGLLSAPKAPAVVFSEQPILGRNFRSSFYLAMLQGAIYASTYDNGQHFVFVNPSEVKATGYDKDHIEAAKLLIGDTSRHMSGHEADAIGIWMHGFYLLRTGQVGGIR